VARIGMCGDAPKNMSPLVKEAIRKIITSRAREKVIFFVIPESISVFPPGFVWHSVNQQT
ncbi:MAG: hypothetical protein PHV05_13675, partial [Candidatus Riflebacteria bacterium]|nr:hypothetical protein [Candidatus Riflebacteria bacterium]